MRRWLPWLLLIIVCAGVWLAGTRSAAPAGPGPSLRQDVLLSQPDARRSLPPPMRRQTTLPGFLPAEAVETIGLIQRGGPFPYRQDGGVFGNREGRLPRQPRGWYREYTVDTPGLGHRGARRIVTGGAPPVQWYYTEDHYDSFRDFDPGAGAR